MPYRLLYLGIMMFCCIGAYSVQQLDLRHLRRRCSSRVLGYVFIKLECEPAPMMLGFILGPLMEENLRRALLLSRGDWTRVRDAADQRHVPGDVGNSGRC